MGTADAPPVPAGGYGVVPRPPSRPIAPQRPTSWPAANGAPSYELVAAETPRQTERPLGERQLCNSAQIVARVGSEVILAGEVLPGINQLIEQNRSRMSADELREQIDKLIQQRLPSVIETRLIYLDAKRTIPPENFPRVEDALAKRFEEVEVHELMERADSGSRQQLEDKLQAMGTSLERQKRAFIQRSLAQQWMHEKLNLNKEITHQDMMQYYHDHGADFDHPARARWEELMVRIAEYLSKEAARAALARLGNRVLQGVPLEQIARAESDGITAEEGGAQDWTTQGSLVAEQIDRALFGLPVGQLSPILESERGYHIVRVTERQEAHRTPFHEAQGEIREKIREQRARDAMQKYMDQLKASTPVWTIFDEPGRKDKPLMNAHER